MLTTVSGSGRTWIIGSKDFDQSLPSGAVFELRFKVTVVIITTIVGVIIIIINTTKICWPSSQVNQKSKISTIL